PEPAREKLIIDPEPGPRSSPIGLICARLAPARPLGKYINRRKKFNSTNPKKSEDVILERGLRKK
ncbi:Hypothetical protein FKW44_004301, partial [Caligus rogercresseyi]